MRHWLSIAEWFTIPSVQADAAERWEAMRDWSNAAKAYGPVWTFLIAGLGLLLAALLVGSLVARRVRRRRGLGEFARQAAELKLEPAEQAVLARVAALAGLQDPQAIFTLEEAFDRGVQQLLSPQSVRGLSPQALSQVQAALRSLVRKLGFDVELPAVMEGFSTLHIPVDGHVTVVGADGGVRARAVVVGIDATGLVLTVEPPLDLDPLAYVHLRYGVQGLVYEFDCVVDSCQGPRMKVRHVQAVRVLNLRRFVRVVTDQEAMVAELPFTAAAGDLRAPSFLPARLKEIAGPGLLLHLPPCDVRAERLIVLTRTPGGRVIQATGAVRRVVREDDGTTAVAVELTDLNPDELAEMVSQTNQAAPRAAAEEAPAAPEGELIGAR